MHEETILRREADSFVCRRFELPSFDHPFHRHAEVELTWIVQGEGTRIIGDHIGIFQAGDLCLIGSDVPHIYRDTQVPGRSAISEVLHFHPEFIEQLTTLASETAGLKELVETSQRGIAFSPETAARVGPMLAELRTSQGLQRWRLFFEIMETLMSAQEKNSLATAGFCGTEEAKSSRRIREVCQWILEHYAEPLRHADLAEKAGMTIAHFSRVFKKATRKTYQQFVTEVRLGHACQQLAVSDKPIIDVAFAVGFNNLSNFNRQFRQHYGLTPRAYRRMILHR